MGESTFKGESGEKGGAVFGEELGDYVVKEAAGCGEGEEVEVVGEVVWDEVEELWGKVQQGDGHFGVLCWYMCLLTLESGDWVEMIQRTVLSTDCRWYVIGGFGGIIE